MARKLTAAAQTAKYIKKHLSKNGIKCSAKSSNFSMGNSVDITLTDQLPATVELVRNYCSKHEYYNGKLNPGNHRADIPQAKYVTVNPEYSDEMIEKAKQYAIDNANRGDIQHWKDRNEFRHEYIYGALLSGDLDGFWTDFKPRQRA